MIPAACLNRLAILALVVLMTPCMAQSPPRGDVADVPPPAGDAVPRAEPAAFEPQKPEFLKVAERLYESDNEFLGRLQLRRLREELARNDTVQVRTLLAVELLEHGETDEAVRLIDEAWETARRSEQLAPLRRGVLRVRGLAHLRQAEVQNCIARHNADCCIFPLREGGVHSAAGPARAALESYTEFLRLEPGDLKSRWLLNLTHMAAGTYPDGVPILQLIPPSAFASAYDIGRFTDVAPRLGLDRESTAGGVVCEDIDGDGLLDIVVSASEPSTPLAYYRNNGRGGFEDRSDVSRLSDQLGGLNIIGGDFDNDGDADLFVTRGAWLFDQGQIRNSLLRNDGGVFVDVTRAAGLADPPMPTQAAAWLDFNNDGLLDLYIGNESRVGLGDPRGDYPSQLFRNNGDGTFTDVARSAGVTNDRYCKGVAVGDFDNDGWMDIYVSNLGPNRLYRNNRDGTFTDVAPLLGVTEPADRAFAPWFWDFDNDGWLDIWAPAFFARVEDVAAFHLGQPHGAHLPRLYRNNGDGTFTDVAARMGVARPLLPMGANFGDLDNDGWLDFYLGTGDPDFQTLMPNVMFRNDAGRRFQDVTTAGGFGHLQKGHGIAFGDIDNDGDQDIFHQLGGFFPADRFRDVLFENPGHGNRFVTIELVGTRSNRFAYGARLTVVAETPEGSREVHRAVGSVSSFGGSPRRQEVGLGKATAITHVDIWWPASGLRQRVTGVPLDSFVRITEGKDGFERLNLPRLRLGG